VLLHHPVGWETPRAHLYRPGVLAGRAAPLALEAQCPGEAASSPQWVAFRPSRAQGEEAREARVHRAENRLPVGPGFSPPSPRVASPPRPPAAAGTARTGCPWTVRRFPARTGCVR
jgi:hypothetical protein